MSCDVLRLTQLAHDYVPNQARKRDTTVLFTSRPDPVTALLRGRKHIPPKHTLVQVSESRLSDLKKEITELEEELEQTRYLKQHFVC